jgi:formylglycine-generating enzyme required for sulfatase activity
MVSVPGGNFLMGSFDGISDSDSNERPVHKAIVTGFLMSKYEVTQEQYLTVTGSDPSTFKESNHPVEKVTWYDALEFCNWLSEREWLQKVYTITDRTPATGYPITNATVTMDMTKNGYRLPTEAEWEYAARGGNGSPGSYIYSGSNTLDTVAWYIGNSGNRTHAVGTKTVNELGLFDMSGNVQEWCWDRYAIYVSGDQTDPAGPSSGVNRVVRGGYWLDNAVNCRSADRHSTSPGDRNNAKGFRIVRRP